MRYVLPFALLKAKDYGKLMPVKVQDKNGNMVTRWVSPEDEKQQKMFASNVDGGGGEDGYFSKVKERTYQFQVQPLIMKAREVSPELSARLEHKYKGYQFDQDTMDLDLKLDFDTVKYLRETIKYPDKKEEIQAEYDKKTLNLSRQINNRKKTMLKLKAGMKVDTVKGQGAITKFSRRGFPVVEVKGRAEPLFVEELKVG